MGRPRVRDDCAPCGKMLTGQASKFCSKECVRESYRQQVALVCKVCRTPFSVAKQEAVGRSFCSHACYASSMMRPDLYVPCEACGEIYFRSATLTRGNVRACSVPCRTELKLRRSAKPSQNDFRDWMIRRNLVTHCNRCGYKERREILVVHHVDRDRNNSDLKNLEVLCPNCHAIEHYGESKRFKRKAKHVSAENADETRARYAAVRA